MRPSIPVYRAEVEAGIAEAVRSTASVAYLSPLVHLPGDDDLRRLAAATIDPPAGVDSFELYFLRDVLVSTGWNLNDDIFLPTPTWAARHTPDHKPFNFEHNRSDILGHIMASEAVDASYGPIADDAAIEDLPDRFHIVNGTVIYRNYGDDDRRARIETTIAEIEAGDWFVSMECYFRSFDYGVIGPDGSSRVLARDESTAFLTKYLRAYPPRSAMAGDPRWGSGRYVDQASGAEFKIGRVLRDLSFSGKGLVRRPGNPDSIIFRSVAAFTSVPGDLGYLHFVAAAPVALTTEQGQMADAHANANDLPDQLRQANATIEGLRGEVETLRSKDVEKQIESVTAERDQRAREATDLKTQLDAVTVTVSTLTKRAEAAEAELKTARDELTTLKVAEARRARMATLSARNAPADAVTTLADQLASLSDEAFAATVAVLAAGWKAPATTKPAVEAERVTQAQPEPDAAMAANAEPPATARASLASYFSTNVFRTPAQASKGGRDA